MIESGSYVDAFGGAIISDNTAGHGVDDTGSLSVIAATIEGNSLDGIHVANGGNAFIASAGVVQSNARDGVQVNSGTARETMVGNGVESGGSGRGPATAALGWGAPHVS